MKSPRQLLTVALALTPLAAAWSDWLPARDSLVVRAETDSSTSETTATPTATPGDSSSKTTTAKETGTSETTTGKQTGSATTTGTGKTTKTTAKSTHTSFNAEDPAGGVTMVSPAVTAAETYYRINGDPITWVWNYTSLQGPPSAIDVMVSCSTATESWTLTSNMTYKPTATFTWDINKFQEKQIQSQLPVAEYTLIIYDADGSPTGTADPGYLAPYSGFKFGLYTPQAYSNLSDWQCYTCSGAGTIHGQALGFAFGMMMVTVFTFTYYVTGALM